MVKKEQEEPKTEESQVDDPTAEKRAAGGDKRVPSQPLRPADIPPAPLTYARPDKVEVEE